MLHTAEIRNLESPDGVSKLMPLNVDGEVRDIRQLRAILRADYARTGNRSAAQRVVMLIFRFGQYQHARGRHGVLFQLWRVADLLLLRLLFGAELPPSARVGPGLALPHCGRGVVLDAAVEIGENSMIFHGVTIAAERVGDGAPRLADNVMVSPGACIVGSIDVGSGARIGPNAVVVRDVAPRSIVFSTGCRVITDD